MRYALSLLADGDAVALFAPGTISRRLDTTNGAVGLLALYSGAPVIPVAISGTDTVHLSSLLTDRAEVRVRFGPPLVFSRDGRGSSRSQAVADDIVRHIAALLPQGAPGDSAV
jgi:1-acyl-sn-glycerol-3-phosphate acyltransferase